MSLRLRRWTLLGVILLAFGGIIVFQVWNHLIRTNPSVARTTESPIPVRAVSVKQTHLTEILGASGEVQPIAFVNLATRAPARVKKVTVDVGDQVTPGQVLIQLDPTLMKAALTTAQNTLRQAAGERDRARDYLRRIKAIYEQGLIAKIDLEKAQAALGEAIARHSEAQEKLVRAKKDLQDARVTSPVLGVVMERAVNPGETPSVNEKLLTIGRIDQILVETKMSEERVGDVYPGQMAMVTFAAFPNDVLEGEVVKIKPVTDPETKTFLVYIKLANPDRKLKPGLTGFVRIKKEHQALAVPSVSIISPTGVQESSIFVVENGSLARLRKVKVGVVAEGMTEILDGLTEGDQVVAVGQLDLKDGDRVRIGDEFNEIKPKVAGELH